MGVVENWRNGRWCHCRARSGKKNGKEITVCVGVGGGGGGVGGVGWGGWGGGGLKPMKIPGQRGVMDLERGYEIIQERDTR